MPKDPEPPSSFADFLFQFYQLIILLTLVVLAIIFYVIKGRILRKNEELKQQQLQFSENERKIADISRSLVGNRSDTLLITPDVYSQLLGDIESQKPVFSSTNNQKIEFEAGSDEEEEEEPENKPRRRIIGEVTVQKIKNYSDEQLIAAREIIQKNLSKKIQEASSF